MSATEIRPDPVGGARQARWQRAVDLPLTVAALVFLVAYSIRVTAPSGGSTAGYLEALILVSWALFPVSYLIELTLAIRPGQWLVRHPMALLFVLLPLL